MSSRNFFSLTFLRAFLMPVLLCAADCPYQTCDCFETTISCEAQGLTAIPPLISTDYTGLTELILDMNSITRIPSGSLPSGLTSISLTSNPTTIIEDTAFEGSADTLQTLAISDFRFTRIPDALLSLNNLQELSIYDATVLDWNVQVMNKLAKTVDRLFLGNVGLNTWPDWIQNFSQLRELTVVDGNISFIPPGTFENAEILTYLFLDNNKFHEVPEAVSNITFLEELSLVNNTISNVTWLPKRSNLTSLSLQTNRISDAGHLSNALLPFKDTLSTLYLQENLLTSVSNLTFLIHTGSLDLSNNRINNIYTGAVQPNLFTLVLEYNYLPALPHFMSSLMSISDVRLSYNFVRNVQGDELPPNTVTVNLDFNLVTELTDTSFSEDSQIRYLHFNNNPLVTISPLAFKNVPLLLELNLRSTKLTRLPETLTFLTRLNTVDFSNSDDLVCTCQEKGLESWIRSLFPSNVIGMCGATSIVDFFTKLSSACP